MKKLLVATALSALFCTSVSFADDDSMKSDSSCRAVAKACKAAGFSKGGDKKFWMECMHPMLLGQTVKGVTIDATQVKACRDKKIAAMQKELTDLQAVK